MSEESAVAIDEGGVDTAGRVLAIRWRPSRMSRFQPVCRRSTSKRRWPRVARRDSSRKHELIEALHTVELTPEVLTTLIDRVDGRRRCAGGGRRRGPRPSRWRRRRQTRAVPEVERRRPGGRTRARRNGKRHRLRAATRAAAPRTRCTRTSRRSAGFRCSTRSSRSRSPRPSRRGTPPAARLAAHELAVAGEGPAEDLLDAGGAVTEQAAHAQRAQGEGRAHRGQPAPGRLDRQALPQPGLGVPRPDPGGQPRV